MCVADDYCVLRRLRRPAGLLGTFRHRLVRCIKVKRREPSSLGNERSCSTLVGIQTVSYGMNLLNSF